MENYTSKLDEHDKVEMLLMVFKYSNNNILDNTNQSNYQEFIKEFELLNIITHEQAWGFFDELGDKDIISYDFWRGEMNIEITQNTYKYLFDLITTLKNKEVILKNEKVILNKRINEILTFNPHTLSNEIKETQSKIEDIHKQIKSNDLLKGLEEPLKHVSYYFDSVSKISNNYDDIYKNIVKPIQNEGKEGIKATVKWAIFSIIISTLLSLIISNWNTISEIISN